MKNLLRLTVISTVALLVVLPLAYGQTKTAPPAQAAEKVFEGQLTGADANAHWIAVKGHDDKEMRFEYTDATQVVGAQDSIKPGAELRITYRDSAGKYTALKIEAVERESSR